MFAQIPYAQYGSRRSYYGNIQLGGAPRIFQVYGAWPSEKPAQKGMLVSDWQEPIPVAPDYTHEIEARIAVIKKLKAEIETQHSLKAKNQLREQMRIEREAKERAFKLKALVDEEESLFILLN